MVLAEELTRVLEANWEIKQQEEVFRGSKCSIAMSLKMIEWKEILGLKQVRI